MVSITTSIRPKWRSRSPARWPFSKGWSRPARLCSSRSCTSTSAHPRVPMSEMLTYGSTLRSITQGRGSFHMEFSHYEEVPRNLQEKIIAESKKAHQEQHAAH